MCPVVEPNGHANADEQFKSDMISLIHRRARFIVATADLSAGRVLADKSALATINRALRVLFEFIC